MLTQLSLAVGLVQLSSGFGAPEVSSAVGLAQLSSAFGVPQLSSAVGLARLSWTLCSREQSWQSNFNDYLLEKSRANLFRD